MTADAHDFRLLGPVEVAAGGSVVPLGGRKQRVILALLLLSAGEPVSRDSLIDALWGEHPPPTAVTALHGYVSGLRKALEPDRRPGDDPSVLVTVEPGYALRADPEQIDAERFRRLVGEGRAAVDPAGAARLLREALALWRGPALADISTEEPIAAAADRLDEERAGALEDRIDADLELGRHAQLVGELEALVAGEPLRERPRAQLMLALYRCGRQADALAAYRDARRTLVGEVGIEPGAALRELEGRMLAQDPALDLAPRHDQPAHDQPAQGKPASREPAPARLRKPRRPIIALAAVALIAAVTAALIVGGNGDKTATAIDGNSVAVIDTGSNRVVADVPVGGTPTAIAAGEGAVWVLNADDQTVSRIDPITRRVKTFGTGGVPVDVAAGEGALWVGNGRRGGAQFVGPAAASVSQFDTATNGLRASVALPRRRQGHLNTNTDHLAVGAGAVWAVGPDFSVSRIDPGTTEITGAAGSLRAEAVAAGPDGVWARDGRGRLERLDRPDQRIAIGGQALAGMAVGEDAVWVTAPYEGKLWRVDSEPHLVARPIEVGAGAGAVAVGDDAVWVANALRGTVSRVDPRTNRVTATLDVGGTPRRLVVAGDRLWVAVAGSPAEQAAASSGAGAGGLPESACGEVFYGGEGRPDALIVSDMPLRGGPALPTRQMSDAIAYVLRERGFRAGRLRVGYQSCDDSTEQSGIYDEQKCAANAKAFAASRLVLGEVGPFNSACARAQIPIAGRAPGGPLAMVGATNTDVGLTRTATFQTEGGLAALYPAGRRNFARIASDEAAQGAAGALEAKALGAKSVYVLRDDGYGVQLTTSFLRAARSLGLKPAGLREWRPDRRSYSSLARAVARSSPDAVYVGGLLDTGGGRVIAALRRALGPGVPIVAGDGLLPVSALFRSAGPAARGVHVTLPGLTVDRLPPAGRHFVAQFGATQPGGRVDEAAVYAAEGASLMLDAIARSDGTRRSVTDELLGASVTGGLLGGFHFDANGDPSVTPITVVRAQRGGGSDRVGSHEGASVERVLHPAPGAGG